VSRAVGMLALGLALCLVASAFAATPLWIPGLALALIAALATGWVWLAAQGVRVVRTLDRSRLPEDGDLRVTVRVIRGHVPLPGAELRAWAGGPTLPVSRGGAGNMSAATRMRRRGRHRLAPAMLEIEDPFGLCRRTVASEADAVLVLPRLEPLELIQLDGGAAHVPGARAGTAADATDVDSLQPLRSGTPASRIHWATVARTGILMERRLVAEGNRLPLVVIDPRDPVNLDALDRAVRAAASLCVHLARGGGCGLLLPGDQRPVEIGGDLSGFPEAHVRLALLGPEAGEPALSASSSAGTVLWVSAAVAPTWGAASVHYAISPHPQPQWPLGFTVAGCRGYRVAAAATMVSACGKR
jgi:uncharacterized protein (DUF58 family)